MTSTNNRADGSELQVPTLSSGSTVLDAALEYARAGFYVLPLKAGTKHPGSIVGKGWEIKSSRDEAQIRSWFTDHGDRGVAIHVGRSGCVAFDVDDPAKLPDDLRTVLIGSGAPYQATRANADGRGHYLLRQPTGREIGNQLGSLANGWGELRGKNGIIVVAPSVHAKASEGGRYEWLQTGIVPELPAAVAQKLGDHQDSAGEVTPDEAKSFLAEYTASRDQGRLTPVISHFKKKVADGESRHEAMVHALCWAMREAKQGIYSAEYAAEQIGDVFLDLMSRQTVSSTRMASTKEAHAEFMAGLLYAIGEANKVAVPTRDEKPRGRRKLKLITGSQTVAKKVNWAWTDDGEGRLPAGTLSVVSGDGNIGKSPFALWLAAEITNGTLEGDWRGKPADVLIYGSEDSWAHTILPRLYAAQVNPDRVHYITGTEAEDSDSQTPLDWQGDLEFIEEAMAEKGARFLIVDPLMDVVSQDSHKDQDVRADLNPLVQLAERTGAVVLGIAHFNKNRSGDGNVAMNGSIAFRNLPRSVFQMARDEESDTYIFTQNKNNLGKSDLPSRTYEMKSVDVEIDGESISQPVFTFTGYSDRTVDDALSSKGKRARGGVDGIDQKAKRTSTDEAADWIVKFLRNQAVDEVFHLHAAVVKDIEKEATANGFSRATLNRARAKLECIVSKQKPGDTDKNKRYWVLEEVAIRGVRV